MNNWRLLLLAVVVVVQPIGSFTESILIDGRECCEHSEDARIYGTERRSLVGNREVKNHKSDERRLQLRDESIGWRYEEQRPVLSRSERTERRVSPNYNRYSRDQTNRVNRLIRDIRDQDRNRDVSRRSVVQIERDSREPRSRNAMDTTRTRDAEDLRAIKQSRDSMSRLPIRNSRSHEERQVAGRETAGNKREVRSGTRLEAALSVTRSDDRNHRDCNKERRMFDSRTQEHGENRRFSNARDSEIRDDSVRVNEEDNNRNYRDVNLVRVELRRQRDIELRANAVNRDSERIQESRDESAELTRNRIGIRFGNARIERQVRRLDSRQGRASIGGARNAEQIDRRSLSLDRLSRFRDETSDETRQRGNRVTKYRYTSLNHEERDSNVRESRSMSDRRDNRESSVERDNTRQTKERAFTRKYMSTDRATESRRVIRDSSEERRLQSDFSRLSRNIMPDSSHRIKNNERLDLRRRVLERSMERAVRQSRSAERRNDVTATHSADVSRIREDTRTNERDERRQIRDQDRTVEQRMTRGIGLTQRLDTRDSRTENNRLERLERKRNDVRNGNRVLTEKNLQNVAQQIDSRKSFRTGSMQLVRQNREEIRENERRDTQRDNTRFDRRSNEREIQAERRQENRDAMKQVRGVQNEIIRNREVRIGVRFDSRQQRHASSRGSERVTAEPRQHNREVSRKVRAESTRNQNGFNNERDNFERDASNRQSLSAERRQNYREVSRQVRAENTRKRDGFNNERAKSEREASNRQSLSVERRQNYREISELTRNRDGVYNARVLSERKVLERYSRDVKDEARVSEAERREGNRFTKEAPNVRDERNLEARRILTDRFRENRDARLVRGDIRERADSRRSMELSMQRDSRIAERLTERKSTAQPPEMQNERMTRNFETQVLFDRTADDRRESRSEMRTNAAERIEVARNFLQRVHRIHAQRDETFGKVNATPDYGKSDETVFSNWKMTLYTLQGIYLFGLLVQMLTENGNKAKKRTFNWWSSHKNLIKVD